MQNFHANPTTTPTGGGCIIFLAGGIYVNITIAFCFNYALPGLQLHFQEFKLRRSIRTLQLRNLRHLLHLVIRKFKYLCFAMVFLEMLIKRLIISCT